MSAKVGINPVIHATASVSNSTIGRYTVISERCRIDEAEIGDFSYIMQDGSTKGNAVLSLAKHLGIPIENVAVFGDNENDLSMFACGAISVAMGNSRDRIKESASYVTGSNRESGVAQAIESYVLPLFGKK